MHLIVIPRQLPRLACSQQSKLYMYNFIELNIKEIPSLLLDHLFWSGHLAVNTPNVLRIRDGLLEYNVLQNIVNLVGVTADQLVLLVKHSHGLLCKHSHCHLANSKTVLTDTRCAYTTNTDNLGLLHIAMVSPFPTNIVASL